MQKITYSPHLTNETFTGVVIKETEKALLVYFYYAGVTRDYNFANWFPKRFVKNNHVKLPVGFIASGRLWYYDKTEQTPEKVIEAFKQPKQVL